MSSSLNPSKQPNATALLMLEDFARLIIFLKKRWWILALSGVLGGLGGIAYAWSQAPKYEAKLTFALEENNSGGGLMSGAVGLAVEQFGLSTGSSQDIFKGENIIAILTSRMMIERTLLSVDTFNNKTQTFAEYYLNVEMDSKKGAAFQGIHFPVGLSRNRFSYKQDSVLFVLYDKILKEHLIAGRPEKKYNLYELKFLCKEERLSKEFICRLLEETKVFYTELRTRRSKNLLAVLELRVNTVKGNLGSAVSRQNATKDANLNPAFSSSLTPLMTEEVNKKAYGEAFSTLFANLEMARLQYLKDVPLLQVVDEPNYPMKKIKKGRLVTGIFAAIGATLFSFLVLIIIFLSRMRLKEQYGN
ncbi:MAG TPA: Wzz/FepE/Etk N-terminal domain-containing protein [Phnomibacter sp.]|nr:Wzz/FepE/Etk N-terminal domain-containing protein [Phnomibacter sp.]